MGFQLQHKSMTLNDLERGCNGRLLSAVLTSCVHYIKRDVSVIQYLSILDVVVIINLVQCMFYSSEVLVRYSLHTHCDFACSFISHLAR